MEQAKLKSIQSQSAHHEVVGVVGGMGPIASAEFVSRVYDYASYEEDEQKAPFLLMVSDPSIPDRTTSFLKGEKEQIFNRLVALLDFLNQAGASRYVICCITIHHIVPLLPQHHQDKLVSLIDVIIDNVLKTKENYLLLSTLGTRRLNILKQHKKWPLIKNQIQYLNSEDQEAVHGLIYQHLKKGEKPLSIKDPLLEIIRKYDTQSIIVGCTEIHLLTRNWTASNTIFYPLNVIDPLDIIAQKIANNQFVKKEEDLSI